MFTRLARWTSRALEIAIVACLALMGVLVFGNVVLRYAFNSGIAVSEELSRLLFVWLIFLGAILASRQHAHIGFDSLVNKLPTAARKALIVATGIALLAASAIFIDGGWKQTVINLENTYPVLEVSYAWLYGVAIVFGVGLAIAVILNIRDALLQPHPGNTDLEMTRDLGDRIEDKMADVAVGSNTGARQ